MAAGANYIPGHEAAASRNSSLERCRAQRLVADVPGWLRAEDASKLYELAYWATDQSLRSGPTEESPVF